MEASEPERATKKQRTRQALVTGARRLMERGEVPSVTDAAKEAEMSRATGYRYFASQHDLLTAVMDEQMEEVRSQVSMLPEEPRGRLEGLVRADHRMRSRHELAFRARLALAVRQWGEREGQTVPRGWRIPAIAEVLQPLDGELSPATFRRLQAAISILVGTESFLILKDMWGLSDGEAEDVLVWACLSLLDTALREESAHGGPPDRQDPPRR